jgi:TatA/E family protein of Tat protein translocase
MLGHFPELLIILAIGLIVFGPEKLPEVAANAGKMIRELREMVDTAMNPEDHRVPDDDFSDYYYESLARSGEDVPVVDDDLSMDMDDEGLWHVEESEDDETPSEEEVMEEHAELHEAMATLARDHPLDVGAHPIEESGRNGTERSEEGS